MLRIAAVGLHPLFLSSSISFPFPHHFWNGATTPRVVVVALIQLLYRGRPFPVVFSKKMWVRHRKIASAPVFFVWKDCKTRTNRGEPNGGMSVRARIITAKKNKNPRQKKRKEKKKKSLYIYSVPISFWKISVNGSGKWNVTDKARNRMENFALTCEGKRLRRRRLLDPREGSPWESATLTRRWCVRRRLCAYSGDWEKGYWLALLLGAGRRH